MAAKVLLVGIGGVGSIAAYTLQANGAEVSAVARSAYDVLTQDGFTIESVDYGKIENFKPDYIFKSAEEAVASRGIFDYIVITTKNIPDVSPVEKMIENAYNKDSTIVLIQNGIDIEKPMFKAYPDATVVSGVTMIGSTLYDKTVKHVGSDIITFGPFINPNLSKDTQIEKAKKFVELYYNEKNKARYDEDVKFTRWRKLVYNSCINTTCALAGLDSGRVDVFGGADTILRPAMREVLEIAKSEGVNLPETIIDFMCRGEDGIYYPPSMLVDVRNGNYIEHVIIIGNVVEIANRNNISVPTLTVLNNLLKLVQLRTMETKGRIILPKTRPLPEDNYKIQFSD
jgi:2-dehydropantoate 2-reductase